MAGTIVVDRIESDASYASTINVAGQITFSNTVNFGAYSGTAPVAGFYLPTTNNLAFTTASTERMRIDSSGNVGIGTSSPATTNGAVTLNVGLKSANNTVLGFETTNLQYGGSLEFRRTARTTQSRFAQITGAEDNSGNGLLYFYTAAAGSDVSENMRLDGSGNLKFNSGYGSVATAYGCRAWVNFNGTTASPSTIRGSGNVTSVTKNGTGDYTVNFTNAMPDANFCAQVTGGDSSTGAGGQTATVYSETYATGSIRVKTFGVTSGASSNLSARDLNFVNVSVFR